ncbi:rRNA-processing protein UTP23 [Manacus vitellinus]|uniref:rRNA-processing protein UTP23 homolog n=3 Tax=Pipridae TaxID=114313 RepID=A0A093SS21_9PASS|nr:rRNA-processing protein UTP23 homolog [Manacus vitellinus]XP_017662032.1 PREDICTED: rRNA-processing protein UTP23 homolog [Lepidothrix coronata]XP_027586391.1 rRNA-processing protein UTP23 homolog [Pipra filicauda]XP_051634473.1 rRNA-processing protein UTP23 homolog [Manacus candei]KFW85389.1 rRNA-processing protein UTP23 [Manacus vitellinus]
MGVTRQKHAKKIMGFYKHSFQFREPFQVLLDGTFCQAALRNKIQIREQLPGYLGGAAQLCTTRCVIKELESLGKALYGAKLIAQRFQVRNCSHHKDPVSGSTCLLSMIEDGNPHHFFIATQDQDLSNKVKKKPGVPLLFIIQNTMVLDKPSPKSLAFVQKLQTNQLVPEYQKQSIVELKEKEGLAKQEGEKRRKRKRAGGPNPLSCLKKKKKKTQEGQDPSAEKKKRRKRKRNRVKAEAMPSVQKKEGE